MRAKIEIDRLSCSKYKSVECARRLEVEFGTTLPASLKVFWREYNGVFLLEDVEVEMPRSSTNIQAIYGLDDIEPNYSVEANRRPGWDKAKLLPIANDSGGNFFLLSVAGATTGAVYYEDHDVDELNCMFFDHVDKFLSLIFDW